MQAAAWIRTEKAYEVLFDRRNIDLGPSVDAYEAQLVPGRLEFPHMWDTSSSGL